MKNADIEGGTCPHQSSVVEAQDDGQAWSSMNVSAALPPLPCSLGRTWMPGAKPPSSPTFTESTPYLKHKQGGRGVQ